MSKALFAAGLIAVATMAAAGGRVVRAAEGDAQLVMNGQPAKVGEYKCDDIQSLVISNGLVTLTFGKDALGDFSATSVKVGEKELAGNLHGIEPRDVDHGRTFYHDYGASGGRLWATQIKIVTVTPGMVHFAVIDDGTSAEFGYKDKPEEGVAAAASAGRGGGRGARGGAARGRPALEDHFVMMKGVSGVYSYAIVNSPNQGGEMRTMYRFDRDLLDYAWNAERTGQQPKYAELEKMPLMYDETWKLPSGEVYQKYDYVAYFAESPMWGHYGHGYGAFFIPASTEYYAGGPMREELIVHQDALILNYLGGGHFSGGGPATNGKAKLFGPWLVYLGKGETNEAVIADAKKVAGEEQKKWPYAWVEEPLYAKERATVSGQLHVTDPGERQTAANAWVVLARPGGNVYGQGGDFIFYTKADASGKFSIPNVRAGSYALYAYAREGSIVGELEKDGVDVKAGGTVDLGTVEWATTKHPHFLWQIGKSDRMAGEFKFGSELRNVQWIQKVPAELEFTIGTSKEGEDWYFAQGKEGHWDVKFEVKEPPQGKAYLTIALAGGGGSGGGPSLQAVMNGTKVGDAIVPRNDASTYRSALRSGRYGFYEIPFDARLLKQGENVLRLEMRGPIEQWHGLMYDTVMLEAD
jgi:rhamnogalacturonan endolyase